METLSIGEKIQFSQLEKEKDRISQNKEYFQ